METFSKDTVLSTAGQCAGKDASFQSTSSKTTKAPAAKSSRGLEMLKNAKAMKASAGKRSAMRKTAVAKIIADEAAAKKNATKKAVFEETQTTDAAAANAVAKFSAIAEDATLSGRPF